MKAPCGKARSAMISTGGGVCARLPPLRLCDPVGPGALLRRGLEPPRFFGPPALCAWRALWASA